MKQYVDIATGEIIEGTLARSGDRVIRKESLQYKPFDLTFVKLHNPPMGLTKTEQKIMGYVLNHDHLRGRDNAILTGNEREIRTASDLGSLAGIKGKRQSQHAVESLIEKGTIAKYDGKLHLNCYIATIGDKAMDKDIIRLFENISIKRKHKRIEGEGFDSFVGEENEQI